MLTIVMYHYVRDLPRTRYPRIKGLSTEKFEGQLDYITRHYTVCSFEQVLGARRGGAELPPNACLLTFDDGLIDHYLTVFPRLEERGLVGSFFPPARAILENRVLDVHKIHFILAATEDHAEIVRTILAELSRFRGEFDILEDEALYRRYAAPGRYDPPEVVFIKTTLQRALPATVRSAIVDELFRRCVSQDEPAFARELYVDCEQLRCMARHGMEIGGHGYNHDWLGELTRSEQEEEIRRTIDFLEKIYGGQPENWVMCYPYGSHNRETVEILHQTSCAFGLTTRVGLAADLTDPLALDRLDTNDLPVFGDAQPCEWTRRVGPV